MQMVEDPHDDGIVAGRLGDGDGRNVRPLGAHGVEVDESARHLLARPGFAQDEHMDTVARGRLHERLEQVPHRLGLADRAVCARFPERMELVALRHRERPATAHADPRHLARDTEPVPRLETRNRAGRPQRHHRVPLELR